MTDSLARRRAGGQRGFTLFEVLIAMLLLAMVAGMLFSVISVGIKFTDQGNRRILAMERKYGFLSLISRQIASAVYDPTQKRILMWADDTAFKLVTRNPYIYPEAGEVLAIYRYNADEQAIYYTEKRDYYNIDYGEKYVPDFKDMTIISRAESDFMVQYDQDTSPEVLLEYRGEQYSVVPKCADRDAINKMVF
ncbi:MAG: prepilin-type N-terminal cleavage/methylation domain-containing protein [Desulfobacteraceae bacterium]|nr:prepilin-type N-terminal cleavage/methylation domain-containing protein [Desulfobacteraceae bacterium]